MAFVGAPHGSGSNHANAAPPCLPTEPRGKESVDAFRERMAAKAAGRGTRRIPVTGSPRQHVQQSQDRAAEAPVPQPSAPPRARRAPARSSRSASAGEQQAWATEYEQGRTIPRIAADYGRGTSTVRRSLQDRGVQLRDDRATNSGGRNAKTVDDYDPQLVAAVTAAYMAGSTVEQIVRDLPSATSSKLVSNILHRAGVEVRAPLNVPKLTTDLLERVLALKADGLTDRAIGERLGFAQSTVSRWLRKHAAGTLAVAEPPTGTATPDPTPSHTPAATPTPAPQPTWPRTEPAPAPIAEPEAPVATADVPPELLALLGPIPARVPTPQTEAALAAALSSIHTVVTAVDEVAQRWMTLALARDLDVYRQVGMLRAAAADLVALIDTPVDEGWTASEQEYHHAVLEAAVTAWHRHQTDKNRRTA